MAAVSTPSHDTPWIFPTTSRGKQTARLQFRSRRLFRSPRPWARRRESAPGPMLRLRGAPPCIQIRSRGLSGRRRTIS